MRTRTGLSMVGASSGGCGFDRARFTGVSASVAPTRRPGCRQPHTTGAAGPSQVGPWSNDRRGGAAPMIAAIYARKSTEQDAADEQKSVTRQVEHARAYAARKGWTVAEDHV